MIAYNPADFVPNSPQKQPYPRTYTIYRLLNTETGNCYIGATVNVKNRKYQHFTALRRCKHINRKLQASYNYFGESAFEFQIIERDVSPDDVFEQETYWIEFYNAFSDGYNFTPTGRPIPELKAATRLDYAAASRKQA